MPVDERAAEEDGEIGVSHVLGRGDERLPDNSVTPEASETRNSDVGNIRANATENHGSLNDISVDVRYVQDILAKIQTHLENNESTSIRASSSKKMVDIDLEAPILIFMASPKVAGLELPKANEEAQGILKCINSNEARRKVKLVQEGSIDRLFSEITSTPLPHVLHFIGHGNLKVKGQKRSLAFFKPGKDGQQGSVEVADSNLLVKLLTTSEYAAHQRERSEVPRALSVDQKCSGLRLVSLSACESQPLAYDLVRNGIPKVIAWRSLVNDDAATIFATEFFHKLLDTSYTDTTVDVERAFKLAEVAVEGYTVIRVGRSATQTRAEAKFELVDPMDHTQVDLHTGKTKNGRQAAGVPVFLQACRRCGPQSMCIEALSNGLWGCLGDGSTNCSSSDKRRRSELKHNSKLREQRKPLLEAAFNLQKRLGMIRKGFLYTFAHNRPKAYAELDAEYSLQSTLYSFGVFFARLNTILGIGQSVAADAVDLGMLKEIEFAFSGEEVDLSTLTTASRHEEWKLGVIPKGRFQLMRLDMQEIGEVMLSSAPSMYPPPQHHGSAHGSSHGHHTHDPRSDQGVPMNYSQFRAQWNGTFEKQAIRIQMPFKRLLVDLQELQNEGNRSFYNDQFVLKTAYARRLIWIHNRLAVLVKVLDNDLRVPAYANQTKLFQNIDRMVCEQDEEDLRTGVARRRYCLPRHLTNFLPETPS